MSSNIIVTKMVKSPELKGDFYCLKHFLKSYYDLDGDPINIEYTEDDVLELKTMTRACQNKEISKALDRLIESLRKGHKLKITERW